MDYFNNLNDEVKAYFKILCADFPIWLMDYINTPEMQRIKGISLSCGTDYSSCFNIKYWYSNLDHSVGVALIIWNFTHDKKATLAGLFHDIATPVFKHCIDFMNNDSEKQESTEERTKAIILSSEYIMALLKRDGILLEEVCDYKIYPIADNDMPMLAADRFEYNFSSGLTFFRVWNLDKIKKVYDNIVIMKNEQEIPELGFKDVSICEEYINTVSHLWPEWVSDKDRTVMMFIADMCKSMNVAGYLTTDDLYTLSEKEVIDKIINCEDDYLSLSFKKFQKCKRVFSKAETNENNYGTNVITKVRYLNPLVIHDGKTMRIYDASKKAREQIDEYLKLPKGGYYTYFDFEFTPYEKGFRKKYTNYVK